MPQIVEAVWEDHALHTGGYLGQGLSLQRSVGFLISNDEHLLKIAMSLTTDDGGEPIPTDVLVVDKRMLVELREVR